VEQIRTNLELALALLEASPTLDGVEKDEVERLLRASMALLPR
jgi:hypothetical protein